MSTAHESAAVRSPAFTYEAGHRQRADGVHCSLDRRADAGNFLVPVQPQRGLRTSARGRARDRRPQHRGHPEPGLRRAGSTGQRAARRAQCRRSTADRLAEARAHALRRQQDAADDEHARRAHRHPEMATGSHPGQHAPASLRWSDRTARGLSHHRPGQGHRPPVRARQPLGAAGSDSRAARHPARQLGDRARHRLSTGAPRAAPDRRPAAQPGRNHAGRGARRLFTARPGHVRRRNRHADARFQRHVGKDRNSQAGAGAPTGTARRRRGRAHQEPRRCQPDAAPGDE